ncbi:OmpA family protein [Elioraea sp.]|uniref:OmpA family protein n=1 Tax=Elioraea sp. TaxID=2185103 RepID=UPI0025BEB8AF|nr:OmpA family protein [Elioraea sp.]
MMILFRTARSLAVAAAALGLLATDAHAQPRDPSASEIIDALRPKPGQFQPATRGIRPVAPSTPAPAQPAATPPGIAAPTPAPMPPPVQAVAPPAAPTEAPAISLTVQFATGSAALTDQATRVLDELGKALTSEDLRPFRFRIEGHTDTVGSSALNQSLSERRAAAVRAYLTQRFGVEPSRLVAIGLGESRLAIATDDGVDEPRNRRVQIVNLGG